MRRSVLLVALVSLCAVGAKTKGPKHQQSSADTVVIAVRDDSTQAAIGCFELAASRPRATGGTPWKSWGGFVDSNKGTSRLGGVKGGVVKVSVSRQGYLDASRYITEDEATPDTLFFSL